MRKNKAMKAASLLLVLTLASSCFVGGTFAKYTTSADGNDTARVAKWGVELQVIGNLYGDTYKNSIYKATDKSMTVLSSTTTAGVLDDVVAPGTKNEEGMKFSLQGTPEVDGTVTATIIHENIYLNAGNYGVMIVVPDGTVTADNFAEFGALYTEEDGVYTKATDFAAGITYYTLEDEVSLTANYYPVEYAMIGAGTDKTHYNYNPENLTQNYSADLDVDTLAKLSEVIGGKFGSAGTPSIVDGRTTTTYTGTTFDANDDLQTVVDLGNQTINWKWDFCQQNPECTTDVCVHCKADTILGNLMMQDEIDNTNKVVKFEKDGEGNISSITIPIKATGNELKDYNLDSYFSIDITVTQTN